MKDCGTISIWQRGNELIKIDTLPKIRFHVFNMDYKKIDIKDYFI